MSMPEMLGFRNTRLFTAHQTSVDKRQICTTLAFSNREINYRAPRVNNRCRHLALSASDFTTQSDAKSSAELLADSASAEDLADSA